METTRELHDQPGLIPRKANPENLESPLSAVNSWLTPNDMFYIRNHLAYPNFPLDDWQLTLEGKIGTPLSFTYEDMLKMPHVSKPVTIECAGNKRGLMEPPAAGDQWHLGGIGNCQWSGVPLSYLLDQAALAPSVREIVFTGIDSGQRPDLPGEFNFSRSLPYDKNLLNECLLALTMNNEPLPFKHGFPVRLIVPGWYGMAHVKWLTKITALESAFTGPFQMLDYVYLNNEDDYSNALPVTEMRVNSIITWPSHGEILKAGTHTVKGLAWAGKTTLASVEISTDNGATWLSARLDSSENNPYTWSFWQYDWDATTPGHYFLLARATDVTGSKQPKTVWNAKGYANNSIHRIEVTIPPILQH